MVSEIEYKRIGWHSRRGMLELDLILGPFVRHSFIDLASDDQQRYIALLEQEDTDIFRWLLRAESPPDGDLKRIVALILDAHGRG